MSYLLLSTIRHHVITLFRFHRYRSNVTIALHITFDMRVPPSCKIHHSSFHHISLFLSFSISCSLSIFLLCICMYTHPSETHFEESIYIYYILYIYSPFLFSLPPLSLSISVHLISLSLSLYISVYLYESESVLYTILPYYKDWTEGFSLCVFF